MAPIQSNGYFDNPYFSEDELKCKGTGELQLAPGFLGSLLVLRELYGRPMSVTSCCRSPEHNKKINGHPNSLHLTKNDKWNTGGTLAIDVSISNYSNWDSELRESAELLGWSLGVGKTFIHLDMRKLIGLPTIVWEY